MEKYQKVRVLGKGSFGSAILIKRKTDGALFVVKEVSLLKMSKKEKDEARHECTVLQQLQHPNIVRYVEQFENRNNLYIVMEYCDGADLAEKVKQSRGPMAESATMYYFSQICLAMEYLHSRHIIHRDIKTMNVFLMKNGAVKLGDFGISTVLRNTMGMANTVCGTPYYFSPELCRNKPYNNKSDIWALGVLLYECATGGRHPFDGNSMNQLMQRIVKGNYAPISSKYSPEFRKMVDWCLQKDPVKRPSIKQLLAYPLMRDSLEHLEQNLMLATQCKIRLNDIIDFESGLDGGASPSNNHHHQESPANSPQKERRPLSPGAGMTPGQAAAMAMAKQMSPATPSALPKSPRAVVSPKPESRQQPNNYQDQHKLVMERLRQQQQQQHQHQPYQGYGAPRNRSPSAIHDLVPLEKKPDTGGGDVGKRNNINLGNDPRDVKRSNDVADRANRFDADMKRVDAIIAKYGKNVDPSAKETIHAFMKRKQEEYLQRQREEAEKREKKSELRQKELQRVLDLQQRNLANRPKSPQRSPMQVDTDNVPLSGGRAQTPPSAGQRRPLSPGQNGNHNNNNNGRIGQRQRMAVAANSPAAGMVFGYRPSSPSKQSDELRPSSQPSSRSPTRASSPGTSDPNSARDRAELMRQRIEERKKQQQQRVVASPPLSPRRSAGIANEKASGGAPSSPQNRGKYSNLLEPIQQPHHSPQYQQRPLSPGQGESPRHRLGALPPVSNVDNAGKLQQDSPQRDRGDFNHHNDANASPSRIGERLAISPRKKQLLSNNNGPSSPSPAVEGNPSVPSTLDSLRNLRNDKKEADDPKPLDKLALLKHRQSLPTKANNEGFWRPAKEAKPRPLSPSAVEPMGRRSPSPSLASPTPSNNSGQTGSDGYSEMLQHLKDLLQKRKIYHNANQANRNALYDSPSPSEHAKVNAVSPRRLSTTKPAHQVPPLNAVNSSDDDDDDDFEDAVPLSPVRCAELNDTHRRQMKPKPMSSDDVYTADAFLQGKGGEEEEELGEDGYTGYYQIPSPKTLMED